MRKTKLEKTIGEISTGWTPRLEEQETPPWIIKDDQRWKISKVISKIILTLLLQFGPDNSYTVSPQLSAPLYSLPTAQIYLAFH